MLNITRDQFVVIAHASFVDRFINLLRERFPRQLEGQDIMELKKEILVEAERAKRYGFHAEQHVATFVLTAWILGRQFDERIPAVAECLARDDMTPAQKADWLEAFAQSIFVHLSQ